MPESRPEAPASLRDFSPDNVRETQKPPAAFPEGSLLAQITSKTPPRRAASLRFTEEGRKLLETQEYPKALARLEKTIAVDATNPYGYFYLAQAHYHLGRYRESLNFLDVAESFLLGQTHWMAKVFALRGENFRALDVLDRAGLSYAEALRLNPENRLAADGMSRIKSRSAPPQR